jgi:hypothetical protein
MVWYQQLSDRQARRPEKRARLMAMQDGRCAMCGAPDPQIGDHDHNTGFLRGLLCTGGCNNRAHQDTVDPVALAYIAAPPAAGLNWLWDLPDWWDHQIDTPACVASGGGIVAYILAHPGRRQETIAMAIAELAATDLPDLDIEW